MAEAVGGPSPTPTGLTATTFDVRTTIGTAPPLPATVRATFTDGYDRDVPITWDAGRPGALRRTAARSP